MMMIRTEKQGFIELTKISLPYFALSTSYAMLVLFKVFTYFNNSRNIVIQEIPHPTYNHETALFLKIYSALTSVTVTMYVLLIPFFIGDIDIGGEGHSLKFLAIPIIAIIGTLFLTINKLANLYGEPLGTVTK